jgi:hypothetical protein
MIFTEQKSINLYNTILGQTPKGDADALVKVGGESLTKFVPNINASKWNDECWLNINNKAVTVKAETQEFKDGKIDLIVGNDCHRYYITPGGTLEYEIIFSSMPKPEILLDLQFSKGMSFFKQPPMNEQNMPCHHADEQFAYDEQGKVLGETPLNVQGGYTIYYEKSNNQYQTGQFGVVYRPLFIDAKGNWIWGELFIDPSSNIISIRCSEKWLSSAFYPVLLDPDLGYTTEGASNYGSVVSNFSSHDITDASGGDTAQIHAAVASGADGTYSISTAIYSDDTGNNRPESRQAAAITITPGNGVTGFVAGNYVVTISASTKYWLAFNLSNAALKIKYNAIDANRQHYYNLQALPASWPDTGTNNTTRWSLYADYAPASGLSIPVILNYYNNLLSGGQQR